MNNDLISRSALKKAIDEIFDTVEVVLFDDIIAIIDNAPTVEIATTLQPTCNNLQQRPQDGLIKAFELLKAYCKNRECNSDCIFYRELRVGNNKEQFCNLCEIVTSDDNEVKENDHRL